MLSCCLYNIKAETMYTERMQGYEVTKEGVVISYKQSKQGKEVSQCKQGKGYLQVSLNGKSDFEDMVFMFKNNKLTQDSNNSSLI